jgi:hypothetical protein
MICTPIAGRVPDRRGPDRVSLVCMLGTLAAAALLTSGDLGSLVGLAGLAAGMLVLDAAMQSGRSPTRLGSSPWRPRCAPSQHGLHDVRVPRRQRRVRARRAGLRRCLGWNGVCLLVAAQAALALAGHILLTRHLPTGHLLGGRRLRASRPASGGGS